MKVYVTHESMVEQINKVLMEEIAPTWQNELDQMEVTSINYGILTVRIKRKSKETAFNSITFTEAILPKINSRFPYIRDLVVKQ